MCFLLLLKDEEGYLRGVEGEVGINKGVILDVCGRFVCGYGAVLYVHKMPLILMPCPGLEHNVLLCD